jgi:hypothetical protein
LKPQATAWSKSKKTGSETASTSALGHVVKRITVPDVRNRKAEALRRLGIDNPSVLQGLPRTTHILAEAEQGLPQVLQALSASDDVDAQAFVQKYDSISPSDMAEGIRWEDIAFAAGITPLRLLEVSVSALVQQFGTAGQIIAATSHPLVTRKTVQMALTDKGTKERKMLLEATGFLPTPKTSTIVGRIQIANLNGSTASQAAEAEQGDTSGLLPSFEDDVARFHEAWLKGRRRTER